MNPASVGLKNRYLDDEDSDSNSLSDYQDRMDIDRATQRSNDAVDSDDDDSLCEIICTVPASMSATTAATIAAASSSPPPPQQRSGASVALRLKRDEQNGRQDCGSTSAAAASPPALTASASTSTLPPPQKPGVSVALRLKRDKQSGHQDGGRTSAAAAASPVTSNTAIKSQPSSEEAGTPSSARKLPPISVALKFPKRTVASSFSSPRRQNSKRTETSADIQQKGTPSKKAIDFASIDAMLSSFAVNRNVERQTLMRKAVLGSKKKKVRAPIARGPITHVVVSHCEKIPLVVHEMHVSHINSSSKALGRAKKEDAVVNTKIEGQAKALKMPLMAYREKLEDLEKVLTALPMHQRFDVRVHKYLHEKLGPIDIPEQYTDISLTQLQEDMQQLHTKGDNEAILTYEQVTDSYRSLCCIQCATLDCHLHMLEDKNKPASCKNQAMEAAIAIAYEEERKKKPTPANDPLAFLPIRVPESSIPFSVQQEYTLEMPPTRRNQFSLSRLKLINEVSGGTTESLQATFGGRHSKELLDNLPPTPVATLNKQLLKKPTTRKMPKGVERRIKKDAVEKPFYFPCSHEGQCTEKNKDCSCVQNHQLCTERCIWGKYSANLFRGCECASGCRSEFRNGERVLKSLKCSCALAAVECDPSICRCKCCHNQNMTHRRSKQFFLAPSTVPEAGWGLFTKYPIAKDDFVGEYVGHFEKDNVNETNRYFFGVCRDFVLDSEKEGNPTRYINHNDKNPNLKQLSLGVGGERKIGFFALKKNTSTGRTVL